jgi:hypothetical protein
MISVIARICIGVARRSINSRIEIYIKDEEENQQNKNNSKNQNSSLNSILLVYDY